VNNLFEYPHDAAFDVRLAGITNTEDFSITELTFDAAGRRRAAALVRPAGDGPFPCILYVHWYEPQACDSNRTQFLEEAQTMAQQGCMSLLIETMWSDRDWFLKRTQAEDYDASIQQVIELRRAMDLLLSQPGADRKRCAYVGHDFGAMVGVLAGSVDSRPTCYVLMAGTPRFADWYLYYPQLDGAERDAFLRHMAPLDPIERVSLLSPAPILFQFGKDDPHVPSNRAKDFVAAAREPVEASWYDAEHGLNDEAQADRMAWLRARLA
jgi:dienelactone hydrolase